MSNLRNLFGAGQQQQQLVTNFPTPYADPTARWPLGKNTARQTYNNQSLLNVLTVRDEPLFRHPRHVHALLDLVESLGADETVLGEDELKSALENYPDPHRSSVTVRKIMPSKSASIFPTFVPGEPDITPSQLDGRIGSQLIVQIASNYRALRGGGRQIQNVTLLVLGPQHELKVREFATEPVRISQSPFFYQFYSSAGPKASDESIDSLMIVLSRNSLDRMLRTKNTYMLLVAQKFSGPYGSLEGLMQHLTSIYDPVMQELVEIHSKSLVLERHQELIDQRTAEYRAKLDQAKLTALDDVNGDVLYLAMLAVLWINTVATENFRNPSDNDPSSKVRIEFSARLAIAEELLGLRLPLVYMRSKRLPFDSDIGMANVVAQNYLETSPVAAYQILEDTTVEAIKLLRLIR